VGRFAEAVAARGEAGHELTVDLDD